MTSGERWSAEELDKLRAGRFAPQAWVRFLRESFRQAAHTRLTRLGLSHQARAWSAIGLGGATAAPAVALRLHLPAPRPRRFTLWWLLVSAMLDWHLGMAEGEDGLPRERLSAADALTLHRLWLIPLLAAQDGRTRRSGWAFTSLIAWAGATDILDGPLARREGPTRLGRDLDKAADTILISVAARAARRALWISPRAARLTHLRSALPVVYVAASYFTTGRRPIVDSLGAGRLLGPVMLGGLAIAPYSQRLGAGLTSAASVASLLLAVPPANRDGGCRTARG